MLLLFSTFLMGVILSLLVFIAIMLISKKSTYELEKASPFECGFNPKNEGRAPISLQFFLIALIFLIFDMELILLFPFLMMKNMITLSDMFMLLTFLTILMYGLYLEWSQMMLEWIK